MKGEDGSGFQQVMIDIVAGSSLYAFFPSGTTKNDFWLVCDESYFNMQDPSQDIRLAYGVYDSSGRITLAATYDTDSDHLFTLGYSTDAFHVRKVARTLAYETGLVNAQELTPSGTFASVISAAIETITND